MTPEYDPFDETQTKINDPDVKINNGIQLILPKDEELGPEYKINNQDLTESQQSRHRRAIPIIPLLSAVGGSIAGSAVTSLALQNTKNAGTGLTESHIQLLKEFATEIAATKIDYQQVYKVINIVVVESLQNFEMQIMTNFDGVTALTMGLDLKGLNQNLQTIAQLRQKGITLSHNRAEVKTKAMIEANKIMFYFEIPILDAKKEFTLYTVTPLPMFTDNATHIPNIDSTHIASNQEGDKFTTLSDLQLTDCINAPPRCHSNTVFTPIQNGISCVALSYLRNTQSCPLIPTLAPLIPRFYFFGNTMVYSTPNVTKIYLKCTKVKGKTSPKDDTLTLSGFGMHQLAPECSLTMPDGTTHVTSQQTEEIVEINNKLFHSILQQNQEDNDEILVDRTDHFSTTQRIRTLLESKDTLYCKLVKVRALCILCNN